MFFKFSRIRIKNLGNADGIFPKARNVIFSFNQLNPRNAFLRSLLNNASMYPYSL